MTDTAPATPSGMFGPDPAELANMVDEARRAAATWRDSYAALLADLGSDPMPRSASRLPWEPA